MTYLADRMRCIADDPDRAALAELRRIAVLVGRMESTLDGIFQTARGDDELIRQHNATPLAVWRRA